MKFHIFEFFFIWFWCHFLLLKRLCSELSVVYWRISSIFYCFWNKVEQKRPKSTNFQNLKAVIKIELRRLVKYKKDIIVSSKCKLFSLNYLQQGLKVVFQWISYISYGFLSELDCNQICADGIEHLVDLLPFLIMVFFV